MGGVAFYNSNNVDGKRLRAFMVGGQEGATAGEQGSYLSFGTVANAGTVPSERIRITSTGISCFACQVCVAGLRSSANVTINKSLEGLTVSGGSSSDATYMSFQANSQCGWLIVGAQGSTGSYIQTGTAACESAITTVGAFALGIGTNQIERMRITSTGIACFACRVCAPSATIAGTLTVTASPGVFDANIGYLGTTYNLGPGETVDTIDFKICGASASTTGNGFAFWTQAGNATPVERLRIDKNGIACFACQVCAPTIKAGSSTTLTSGNITLTGFPTSVCFGNGQTLNDDGSGGLTISSGAAIGFTANSSERMRITSVGNIGIGATTVRSQVHIQNGNTIGNTAIGTTGKNVTCGGCSILFCFRGDEASMTGQLMITGQTGSIAFSAIYDVISIYEGVCLNRRFCMSRGVGEIINVNAFGTNNYDKILCISQTNPYNGTMSISATFIGTSSVLTYLCAP